MGESTIRNLCTTLLIFMGLCALILSLPSAASPSSQATHPTRIYSCTVGFPNDSVAFDEERVLRCLKKVDEKRISYIHVIATATLTGSNNHNLYLSTRRAGAIEGFLKNRYPTTQIHAFGGGINPRFGKVARIFVVEGGATEAEGISLAANLTAAYEPPEAPKVITKTLVVKAPRSGVWLVPFAGLSFLDQSSTGKAQTVEASNNDHGFYQMQGIRGMMPLPFEWLPWKPMVGMSYALYRTNQRLDVHRFAAVISTDVYHFASLISLPIVAKVVAEGGAIKARRLSGFFGGSLDLGYQFEGFRLSSFISKSTHTEEVGAALTTEI